MGLTLIALSITGRQALANDEGDPFYSITCGSERACAQEESFVPGQYINLGVTMVDHLIMDINDKGVSVVIPYSGTGNVRPPQGSVELRFDDGRPSITLGNATLVDADGGLYAIHFLPSIDAEIATVGHGTEHDCDPGGAMGPEVNVLEYEKNQLTLKMPNSQTVVLHSNTITKQLSSYPALFGCH
jgi:hypothetical protein